MKKFLALLISFILCFTQVSWGQTKIVDTSKTYTYEQMKEDLYELQKKYPGIIKLSVIGKSEYGRDIYEVKLGTGKPILHINASHHAREWIGTTLTMKMVEDLAIGYYQNEKWDKYNIKETLSKTTISFVPMLNPDGVTLQQSGLKSFPTSVHSQLISMNGGSKDFKRWKANAKGIDLNRQYNANWYTRSTPTKPSYASFKGNKPEEAKEVVSLLNLVKKDNPEMVLSYHTSGELIYWKFGQDKATEQRDYSYAKQLNSFTGYELVNSGHGMEDGKGFKDWFVTKTKKPGFTLELSPYVGQTNVPLSNFNTIWNQNKYIPLYLAEESYKLYSSRNSNTQTPGENVVFSYQAIDDKIKQKINGVSYKPNKYVKMEDLSYLKVTYYGYDKQSHVGELIVHKKVAPEVVEIFKELYAAKFPIEKIRLVDEYKGDDNLSMADNNTSAFNYRNVPGTTNLSRHSLGLAIDINPVQNPYLDSKGILYPKNSSSYLNRNNIKTGMIMYNDVVYKAFTKRGWTWGGNLKTEKDYQHFQKNISIEPTPAVKVISQKETTTTLNMRSGPSTKYKTIITLKKGTKVDVLESKNGWDKIKYGSNIGYTSNKYLKTIPTKTTSKPQTTPAVKVISQKETTTTLNMRSGPSTKDKTIITLKKGTKVDVLESKNGWDKIKYGSKIGYASNKYLKLTKSTTPVEVKEPDIAKTNTAKIAEQIIAIKHTSGSNAKIEVYEKVSGKWKTSFTTTGRTGKNGVTYTKEEGDGKSPVGVFTISKGFGIANNPGTTKLPYTVLQPNDYWVDDPNSQYYNMWMKGPSNGRWNSAEELYSYKTAYKYAMVIDYNKERIPNKGSAIFLHVNTGGPTEGCISVDEASLVKIMKLINPGKTRIIISPEKDIMKF